MNNNMGKQSTIKKIRMNFSFGIIGQLVTMIVGIIVPRLFIMSFGSEVNGFISSMNQIFIFVALLEAGVGGASLQALYKPIGKYDHEKINAILTATHYFYKRTGILYIIAIVLVASIYPLIVTSSMSYFFMFGLIILTGSSGAIPYFAHAKYRILLQAEGKNYFITNISTINQIGLSLGKAVLILFGFNVFAVQGLYLLLSIIQAVIYKSYIANKYKWINLRVVPDYDAISQKNAVIIHQISTLVFNNTDILFLTFFLGLKAVSIYTLYKMLVTLVGAMISNCMESMSFRLGQIFQDREKFVKWHDIYETFHIAITFALYSITLIFLAPFLKIYTTGMDINYLIPYMPLCAVTMEILNYGRMPSGNIITFAGHFKQTQWRAVLESLINLIATFICIHYFGICGVLIGTIIALLYRTNDIIVYSNKKILGRSVLPTYKLWIGNILFSCCTVFIINKSMIISINNYSIMILYAILLCAIIIPLQIILSFVLRKEVFKNLILLFRQRRILR